MSTRDGCSTEPDRRFVLAAAVCLASAWPRSGHATPPGSEPIATTRYGKIRGYADGPIKVFKGVPYGADTGGSNRWLPPKAPTAWRGVRDAQQQGPMCPQVFGAPLAEETAMLQAGPMSEDCLNLNVFTPAVGPAANGRPVMVWFHGGGYFGGSGGAASYDGRNLCEKHDVVLVSVTHRLNIFGFLFLEEAFGPAYAQSGNAGMLDCVAALRWVRDNIAEFGGDRHNVTIFGQSGGAGKVATLMAMPAAKGLFHRAIQESGTALRAEERMKAADNAGLALGRLGSTSLRDLQGLPATALVDVTRKPGLAWQPMLDPQSLPHHPPDPAADALSAGVPLICGVTQDEATFVPWTPLDNIGEDQLLALVAGIFGTVPTSEARRLIAVFRSAHPDAPNNVLYQLISSQTFAAESWASVDRRAALRQAPVYAYYFKHPVPARNGKLGAPHTAEIPYVFDSLAHAPSLIGPPTAREQALAAKVSAYWTTFARTGAPGGGGGLPTWQRYDDLKRAVLVIDDDVSLVDDPTGPTRVLIEEFRQKYPPVNAFGAPPRRSA